MKEPLRICPHCGHVRHRNRHAPCPTCLLFAGIPKEDSE